MAYSPRADGLFDVTLDSGITLPMALSEEQLQAAGHQPLQAPAPMPLPKGATAFTGDTPLRDEGAGGAPQSRLDAPVAMPGAGGAPQVDPAQAGGGTLGASTLPANEGGGGAPSSMPEPSEATPAAPAAPARANPRNLMRVAPSGGYASPAVPQQRLMRIPGGDQRQGFTRVPGQPVSEDVRRDLLDDTRPEDLTLSADRIATMRDELSQQREQALLEQQQLLDQQKARRIEVDRMLAEKSKLIDERDREAEKLKPQTAKEIWAEKGTFGRISAAITMGLGAYNQAAGFTRDDEGTKLVMETIRQDIDDQRARYEDAKRRRTEAMNDYARAIQVYGTPEAADLDMQMRRLALVEKQIAARAEQVGTQEYLQAANAMATELRQQRAATRQKLEELEQGKILQESWVTVPDRYVGMGGGAAKPKKPDTMVRLPNGQYMFARDPVVARKAQEKVIANARLAELSQRMHQLTDTVGKRAPTAEERAQAETIKSEMMFTYKDASQAGALDKGLQDAMAEYLGRAEDVFQVKDNAAKLREVGRIAQRKVLETIEYELHPDENYSPSISPRPAGQESDE